MPFFQANHRIEGLTKEALLAGDTIETELTPQIEQLTGGNTPALTPLAAKPTEPAPEPELETLSDGDLVAYAKRRFGFELEPSLTREAKIAELAFLRAGNADIVKVPVVVDVNAPPKTFPEMTKAELVAFAKEKHGEDLDFKLAKPALIAEVEALEAKK